MNTWKSTSLAVLLALGGLTGCDDEPAPPDEPVTEPVAESGDEAEAGENHAEEPTGEAGPRVEQEGYVVELRGAEGEVTAGELTQLALVVEGQGEWHINQDFPFAVEVRAPEGVQMPKTSFGKSDAASFADEAARVDVPLTPTAGEHRVQAQVRFAICNPQSCVPKTETVVLALHAE